MGVCEEPITLEADIIGAEDVRLLAFGVVASKPLANTMVSGTTAAIFLFGARAECEGEEVVETTVPFTGADEDGLDVDEKQFLLRGRLVFCSIRSLLLDLRRCPDCLPKHRAGSVVLACGGDEFRADVVVGDEPGLLEDDEWTLSESTTRLPQSEVRSSLVRAEERSVELSKC